MTATTSTPAPRPRRPRARALARRLGWIAVSAAVRGAATAAGGAAVTALIWWIRTH